MSSNKSIPVALIICIAVIVACIVLICIPDSIFEDKTEEIVRGELPESSESSIMSEEPKNPLQVIFHSNGYVQFNTVFGGTDYEDEYQRLKDSYPSYDFDSALAELGSFDLDSEFDALQYSKDSDEIRREYSEQKVSDFTITSLEGNSGVRFQEGVLTCAVLNNYYVVYWLCNTDYFIVEDWRNVLFTEDYFIQHMVHLGVESDLSLKSEFSKVVSRGRYTFVFKGAFVSDR